MDRAGALKFHWDLAEIRDGDHWLPVDDGGTPMFAKISLREIQDLVLRLPTDDAGAELEVSGRVERAVANALVRGATSDVFVGLPPRFAYRQLTVGPEDFAGGRPA